MGHLVWAPRVGSHAGLLLLIFFEWASNRIDRFYTAPRSPYLPWLDSLSDEKRMGRRRAARTFVASSYSTGRALTPVTPTDLVKHVPRKFATLWAGTANGHRAGDGQGGHGTVELDEECQRGR